MHHDAPLYPSLHDKCGVCYVSMGNVNTTEQLKDDCKLQTIMNQRLNVVYTCDSVPHPCSGRSYLALFLIAQVCSTVHDTLQYSSSITRACIILSGYYLLITFLAGLLPVTDITDDGDNLTWNPPQNVPPGCIANYTIMWDDGNFIYHSRQ